MTHLKLDDDPVDGGLFYFDILNSDQWFQKLYLWHII